MSSADPRKRLLVVLDVTVGTATAQVRGLRFQKKFAEAGWACTFVDVRDAREAEIVELARSVAVVYLVKVRSLDLLRAIRAACDAKIVFDFTDALWQSPHRHEWRTVESLLLECDAVFSENEYVCAYARRFNDQVVSIPVCTLVEQFDETRRSKPELLERSGAITIGWIGTHSTVRALEKIKAELEAVCARFPRARLRFVGVGNASFANWRAPLSSVPKYDEQRMVEEILGMDVGIYPPPFDANDYAIRGSQKAMLYMTGGAAPVALDAGDCADRIQHRRTGMLVPVTGGWERTLAELLGNEAMLAGIREAAMQQMRSHTIEAVFETLASSLLAVVDRPRAGIPVTMLVRARFEQAVRNLHHRGERTLRRVKRKIDRVIGAR